MEEWGLRGVVVVVVVGDGNGKEEMEEGHDDEIGGMR